SPPRGAGEMAAARCGSAPPSSPREVIVAMGLEELGEQPWAGSRCARRERNRGRDSGLYAPQRPAIPIAPLQVAASATGTGMLCAPTDDVVERLNSLLRVELAAVAGYQRVLRALKKKAVGDHDQILRFASEHQRTVAALEVSVQDRGGAPVVEADPWGGSGVAALTAEGASARLEDK